MAFNGPIQWEVRATGSDSNGGGFDPSYAGITFATDLTATGGTSNSPVLSSASYVFVSADVNSWVFIPAGTGWNPGFYKISSVAGGNATVNAAIGAAIVYEQWVKNVGEGLVTHPNIVAGVATVASPTGGTWAIDYTQSDSAYIAFTDIVIDATTNTKATSAAHPFTKAMIGNVFNFVSGTGFTVQRAELISVTGTTGTFDKSLGTLGSTGGNANLGGAMLDPNTVTNSTTLAANGAVIWLSAASTFTRTTSIMCAVGGSIGLGSGGPLQIAGYDSVHGDQTGNQPLVTSATNGVALIDLNGKSSIKIRNLHLTHTATTRGPAICTKTDGTGSSSDCVFLQCVCDGCLTFLYGGSTDATEGVLLHTSVHRNEIKNCTESGVRLTTPCSITCNNIHDNSGATVDGIFLAMSASGVNIEENVLSTNGRNGIRLPASLNGFTNIKFNDIYNNGSDGLNSSGSNGAIIWTHVGNIYWGNGGFGISIKSSEVAFAQSDYNFYGSNTSGAYSKLYSGQHDVTLTANPFNADFSLNSTAGGGALVKAAAFPGLLPGLATAGFRDGGALQSQALGVINILCPPRRVYVSRTMTTIRRFPGAAVLPPPVLISSIRKVR